MEGSMGRVNVRESGGFSCQWDVDLSLPAQTLMYMVSDAISLAPDGFRLLHAGRFLRADASLTSQGVRSGARILIMRRTLTQQQTALEQQESDRTRATRLAAAAERLAESRGGGAASHTGGAYVELEDQNQDAIDLPEEIRKPLVFGLTLHQQGRKLLAQNRLQAALEIFLDADKEIKKCPVSVLRRLDNYAILCLDIVWAMFKLRDINSLPAARNWLQRAEDGLNTAYGANLERVAQIKGDTSAEQALYVRLWLLKGALAFYSGNRETAAGLLMEAEERLRPLQVPDDQLATMMSMGFREREARFALRATRNDPDRAVEWVLRHRQERAEKRHRQRQDEQVARMNALRQIQRMGFNPALAAQALRQTDNNVLRALDLLTEHGDRIPAAPSVDAPWLGEQAERTRRRSRDAGDRKEEGEEEEEEEEEEDAFQEVVEDVSHDSAEAFLDLTLNEEAQAIRELLAACVGDIPRST